MFWLFNNEAWQSQKQIILEMLKSRKEVSPRDMMLAGIARYGAHIFELRKEWHNIVMREETKRDAKNQKLIYRHTFYSLTF